jgi:hypothetical protein
MPRLSSTCRPARLLFGALALAALPLGLPAAAQTTAAPAPQEAEVAGTGLDAALRLRDLFAVLVEEGMAHGATLEAEMFPSGGGLGWAAALDRIHDEEALHARFVAALEGELAGDPLLPEILAFFGSDLGTRVIGLEIEARRTFIDDAAEDAARVAADKRRVGRDPRHEQLERFIAAGDLLEMNVAGALSGNLGFLTGMNDSGVYGAGLPQDELMAQVWGQEAQIRDDTASWLHAYLGLAYQPLTDAELDRYIAFWESPAGKRLNAALFVAFDQTFRQVSYELGNAAGLAMQGRDI